MRSSQREHSENAAAERAANAREGDRAYPPIRAPSSGFRRQFQGGVSRGPRSKPLVKSKLRLRGGTISTGRRTARRAEMGWSEPIFVAAREGWAAAHRASGWRRAREPLAPGVARRVPGRERRSRARAFEGAIGQGTDVHTERAEARERDARAAALG